MPRTDTRHSVYSGFTIIELLVVMSVMIILLAALVPSIYSIDADGRLAAGVNTVSSGAQAARAQSARKRAALLNIPAATDSGVALIFTPAGELRLAVNDQQAASGGQSLENAGFNGYKDISSQDYIVMPRGIGVAGIVAPNTVIPPPFAVRFDGKGGLIAGIDPSSTNNSSLIVYDSNFDANYDTSSGRDGSYDPNAWDPRKSSVPKVGESGVWALPFETLEPVIGVIVYSQGDFEDNNLTWSSAAAAIAWLTKVDPESGVLENGKVVLFSRYSGAATR